MSGPPGRRDAILFGMLPRPASRRPRPPALPVLVLLALIGFVLPGAGPNGAATWAAVVPAAASAWPAGAPSDSGAVALEAKLCIVTPGAGAPLEEFGHLLWRRRIDLNSAQSACLGDLFYEGGTAVEFGLIASRYRDRLYFRTSRRILREWALPAPGQPDSALAWAETFVSQFTQGDTLFVDLRARGTPLVARGERGARAGLLFRHWVARKLTPAEIRQAASLGVNPDRLILPPPEPVCPPGGG